ncbi:MAG: Holliday junction resolvase RuvX [Bacteroidota bacterium]
MAPSEAPKGRVLAVDYGRRRVGLALSDPLRVLATGLETVENAPGLASRLASLVREQEVSLVVVGLPYDRDGECGESAREVLRFIAQFASATDVPVRTWDESFSSEEAKRLLRAGGAPRKRRRARHLVDRMAAQVILQEFLDSGAAEAGRSGAQGGMQP